MPLRRQANPLNVAGHYEATDQRKRSTALEEDVADMRRLVRYVRLRAYALGLQGSNLRVEWASALLHKLQGSLNAAQQHQAQMAY